jgi:hypothetical protein
MRFKKTGLELHPKTALQDKLIIFARKVMSGKARMKQCGNNASNRLQMGRSSVLYGYSVHPFEKEAPLAFTAHFFLVVKWDSANDRGGESFSFSRENTEVWTTNHEGRHA